MGANCPTCGRSMPKPKISHPSNVIDLNTVPEVELFKYYKQTAPVEDTRFALRIGLSMSPELRADWEALALLAPGLNRADTYRRLTILQGRWRSERETAERLAVRDVA